MLPMTRYTAIHHENEIHNLMETKQNEYNNKVKSKSK